MDKIGTSARFSSYVDSFQNAFCAVLERVFYHEIEGKFQIPYAPSYGDVCALLKPFWRSYKPLIQPATPVTLELYPYAYSGRRFKLYQRAASNVLLRGVRVKDSYLQSFIKHEKILESSKRTVARLIQPRTPEYNVSVGRYIRHLEHTIFHTVDTIFGSPTIMKGYNAFKVGQVFHKAWASFREPVGVGLDASRFDQHISKACLQWEHRVYQNYYPGNKQLAQLLTWQLNNKGVIRSPDGNIWYHTEGTRCSGDMNTSLGNCVLMTAALYSYAASLGLKPGYGRLVALNNGDDCMVILERVDVARFVSGIPSFFKALGFVMKVEQPCDKLEQLSFCQTQPVYDGHFWRMVRNPHVSLSKDATILDHRHATNDLSAQLFAIGECGLALTSGIPVLQSYYLAMQRGNSTRGHVDPRFFESGMYHLSCGCRKEIREISVSARVSFYNAFGIVPDQQIEVESYYDSLDKLGTDGVHHGAEACILLR